MKKNIGQKLALYPTPATVVGTIGKEGKVNLHCPLRAEPVLKQTLFRPIVSQRAIPNAFATAFLMNALIVIPAFWAAIATPL